MLKSKLRPLPAFNEKGLDDIAPTEVASAPPETEAAPDKPEDADKTFVVCFCIWGDGIVGFWSEWTLIMGGAPGAGGPPDAEAPLGITWNIILSFTCVILKDHLESKESLDSRWTLIFIKL